MKILIDIPEKIEEYIKDYIPIGAGNNVFCYPDEIVRMIQNGIPIPDNVPTVDVLEKIRTEIYQLHCHPKLDFIKTDDVVDMALDIIDKYK